MKRKLVGNIYTSKGGSSVKSAFTSLVERSNLKDQNLLLWSKSFYFLVDLFQKVPGLQESKKELTKVVPL